MIGGNCKVMSKSPTISCLIILLFCTCIFSQDYPVNNTRFELAALFSYASYCPENVLSVWKCYWCLKVTERVKVEKTIHDRELQNFAYVASTNEFNIVAFRGTVKGINNWINNLNASLMNFENTLAKVHKGFYNTWLFYSNTIYQTLYDLENRDRRKKPVLVVGHSRGGAIASIAAIELSRRLFDVEHITFGQPRVGDTGFVRMFDNYVKKSYRIVNKLDIVARLPSIIFQYYHVPREVWYKEDGTIKVCARDEDLTCSRSTKFHRLKVEDHMLYLGFNLQRGYECSNNQ